MTSGTEEEQLAQIKEWWQRNGKPLLLGGALALVVVFGWQFWQKHQLNQAQGASALYQQLLNVALAESGADTAEVSRLGNLLQKEFSGSHYAQYGSLFLAKGAVCWIAPPTRRSKSSPASVWRVYWRRRTRPKRRWRC